MNRVEGADGHLAPRDAAESRDESLFLARRLLAGLDAVPVFLRVGELERVGAFQPEVMLGERARIEDQLEAPADRKRKVLVALGQTSRFFSTSCL